MPLTSRFALKAVARTLPLASILEANLVEGNDGRYGGDGVVR
jgi:hypothetical protein